MPAKKGETWNESETYKDPWTLREVRRVTTSGLYNQTPTYHTNICFTEDGEYFVFASARDGKSAVYKAHTKTGDITQLIDPLEGVGGYGALNKGTGVSVGNGLGVDGGSMCIAPKTRWLTYVAGTKICAVHLDTLEERTLADLGPEVVCGTISVDPTETKVSVSLNAVHPQALTGERITTDYMAMFPNGDGQFLRIIEVPLTGGEVKVIYNEDNISGAHSPHNPVDGDLMLIDRDFPPRYWAGSDGKTNRIWTLRLSTGEVTELPNQDDACFQVHSGWTWDGEQVVYHGISAVSGYYIGVINKDGTPYREYGFRGAPHYGHVSPMAGRPAIIIDGNITPDMLLWVYYDQEQPRVEAIAKHNTNWGALPGQYPHPHAHSDPTGSWISFNVGLKGRTDVCVVKV